MDRRYQVFVSSTFSDLKNERQSVMQTLMEMDCIPAGMELFPAADEEQWIFIQKIIDDCDYYVLILGGRYGSITKEGISYTEKEFDYAVSKGIKVIALVHGETSKLPFEKVDADDDARRKLETFRDKVLTGRLARFWKDPSELPGLVSLSLQKTIKMYPAVGWVRGNTIANSELLSQLNEIRSENEQLKKNIQQLSSQNNRVTISKKLATGEETFTIDAVNSFRIPGGAYSHNKIKLNETWNNIFSMIGTTVSAPTGIELVKEKFEELLREKYNLQGSISIAGMSFSTISVQLTALGLISIKSVARSEGGPATSWHITEVGQQRLFDLLSVSSQNPE